MSRLADLQDAARRSEIFVIIATDSYCLELMSEDSTFVKRQAEAMRRFPKKPVLLVFTKISKENREGLRMWFKHEFETVREVEYSSFSLKGKELLKQLPRLK